MNQTNAIFNHPATYAWISNLTDRYTDGPHDGSPSRYFPGDFSMPHADYADDRTVAYVWHLSRDWRREWGGALYWCGEAKAEHAYVHATYNTLNLFSVTRDTEHFVTIVSPDDAPNPSSHKRLTWNGWWRDAREYDYTDPVETMFDTYEKRLHLTSDQQSMLLDVHDIDEQVPDDPYRRARLYRWKQLFREEINEPRINSYIVDLYGSQEADDEMYMLSEQQEADMDEYDDDEEEEDDDEDDEEEKEKGDDNDSNAKNDN